MPFGWHRELLVTVDIQRDPPEKPIIGASACHIRADAAEARGWGVGEETGEGRSGVESVLFLRTFHSLAAPIKRYSGK